MNANLKTKLAIYSDALMVIKYMDGVEGVATIADMVMAIEDEMSRIEDISNEK